jgi:hypothetical protein
VMLQWPLKTNVRVELQLRAFSPSLAREARLHLHASNILCDPLK